MDKATFQAGLGPAAQDLLTRDTAAYLFQSGSTPCLSAVRDAQASGWRTRMGAASLDFHGNSATHIGYAHPRLTAALTRQLTGLTFAPRRFTLRTGRGRWPNGSAPYGPAGAARVLLATGGSDAGRNRAEDRAGGHGTVQVPVLLRILPCSGFGAMSVSGRKIDRPPRLGPLLAGALHVPPYSAVAPGTQPRPTRMSGWPAIALAAIRTTLDREGDIAALIAEPLKNTPHMPPDWFWPEVRVACDRHGALADLRRDPDRPGQDRAVVASEHWDVRPDITVLGKALGGGIVPIAATILNAGLNIAPELALGHYTHERTRSRRRRR